MQQAEDIGTVLEKALGRCQCAMRTGSGPEHIDRPSSVIVLKGLKKLRTEPEKWGAPLGSKLGGHLTTFRKLLVGRLSDGSVVVVWVIGRRTDDEVYQLAMSRLRLHPDWAARVFATALDEIWHA